MAWFWKFIWPSETPTVVEFLRSSRTNIERINSLTSHQSRTEVPLNLYQCRSMSSKLLTTLGNVEHCLAYTCDGVQLPTGVLESFYLVSERAKELVESCCSKDWCQASTFQIQNEEAFREILLETSLFYSTIFELVKDKVDPHLDLRGTSTFDSPALAEVSQDRRVLQQRYEDFVNMKSTSKPVIRKQHLAKYLLSRSKYIASQSSADNFGSLWPDGKSPDEEWGNSDFLGGNVCRTTWIGVPCAKKVFELVEPQTVILAEARILARLNHPNIVKFICWGKDSKTKLRYFIAMEQMEEALSFVIRQQAEDKNEAPFPLRSAVDIMLQIAYGTCYLHENGIAHRDLKTSNVVVSRITTPHLKDYLRVKLVDFGLSKVKLSASRSNSISRPKIGTTTYMPPEAFHDGRANWFKADVYSFGMTCSAILSGHEPFKEIPRDQLYEAICKGVRPPLPPETPRELASLVERCWATDRNARPDFVDICTSLAKLRDKLLREDLRSHNNSSEGEVEDAASWHIQETFKKRSDSRKAESSHFQLGLPNVRNRDQMLSEIIEPMETLHTENEPSEHSVGYLVNDNNEPNRKPNSISFGNSPPDPLPSRSPITSPPAARGSMNRVSVPSTAHGYEPINLVPVEDAPVALSPSYPSLDVDGEPIWVPKRSDFRNTPQSSDSSSLGTFIAPPVQLGSLDRGYQANQLMPTSSPVLESNARPKKSYAPRSYSENRGMIERNDPSTSLGNGTTGVMPVQEEPIEHSLKFLFNETVEPTIEKSSRRARRKAAKK